MTETTGLLAAMLAVQGEAPTMPKDRTVKGKTKTGGEYTYSYTPLDTIVEKVGPLLHKNGLVWSTLPGRDAHGDPALRYRLAHATTGEVLEGEMPLMLADQDAQSMGSAITYMRRYALCAVLNIVADADDDGALATANGGQRGGALATDAQKKFRRTLITQNRLDEATVRRLFSGVGFAVEDGEKVNDAVNRLTKAQCSSLIEFIKEGAIPTGESDVPAPEGFEHPVDQDSLPVN
jgi:hypothetical protein